jgi:hypothetical protein
MFEYAAVAGGGIQGWWTGQMLPFMDMIRASSYFWPGVMAASLIFFLSMRQFIK